MRQMRGSFSTKKDEPPYSASSAARARASKAPAFGDASQPGSKACQSSQAEPAEARSSSFSPKTDIDSQ